MKTTKFLCLSVALLIVFALSLAIAEEPPKSDTTAADPAIQTQPAAPTEANPGTAPAPAPVPEAKPAEVAPAPAPEKKEEPKKEKKSKKVNKTRKVKTACDIFDNPDGKKVGTLKVGTPIWTDEHAEGWLKVYRKNSVGYAKTDCFE